MTELEESRGWIHYAKDAPGEPIMDQSGSRMNEVVRQECERPGVRYQIAGKHCSFVVVLDDDLAGYEIDLNDIENIPSHEGTRVRSAPGKRKMASQVRRPTVNPDHEENTSEAEVVQIYDMGSGVEEPESDEDMGFICATPCNAGTAAFDPVAPPVSDFFVSFDQSLPEPSDKDIQAMLGPDSTSPGLSPAGSSSPSVGPSGSRSMAVSYKTARGAAQFCCAASSDQEDIQDDDDVSDDHTSIHSSTFATQTPLQKFIILQAFVGYWQFSDELLQILGLDSDTIRSNVDGFCKMKRKNHAELPKEWLDILATALVGHFLEQKAFDSRDEWELVKMKADDLLQRQVRSVLPEYDAFVMSLNELCWSFF
ncbi:uncharacterized protein N7477_001925 [Penicillium maclennaniae]|uniref:uncharacterized protein n=1 Tax=Penicillium maclennaniae TaxID=1343394 RepID=UPI0025418100|nr:uncharacterized protein N7477_001925 [Penicillium maclennaniae]KAJ5681985.1 hypothetical protein N7477_001925 [Penicillium maclennaniae]